MTGQITPATLQLHQSDAEVRIFLVNDDVDLAKASSVKENEEEDPPLFFSYCAPESDNDTPLKFVVILIFYNTLFLVLSIFFTKLRCHFRDETR